jgi:DNA-binding winged helix-turn-helix (wHTH) protein/TolB-like protein/tetratricopeptide (TPR) repeat protein
VSLQISAGFRFGGFLLDHSAGGLFRLGGHGGTVPIMLGSRALDVLGVLVERQGELVPKQTIMDAVWPDTAVEENNLTVQISALRRVLDQGRTDGSCIQTIPGRGYRFVAPAPDPVPASEGALPKPEPPEIRTPPADARRRSTGTLVAGAVAAVALLAVGGWWAFHANSVPLVTIAAAPVVSRPAAYSPQDRRQSVILLPFENSSGDPSQDGIAAGITRDVMDQIGTDHSVPLVPAATAAAYRGKTLDLRVIGRDHNVHFALTGNARREGTRLIVSATLYETDDERPLWSQRFDRQDRPDGWNSIVATIDINFQQTTMDAEVARAAREHPDSLDKRDLMFAATTSSLSQISKENWLASITLMNRALAIDPNYVWALRAIARAHADLVLDGFSSDPDGDLAYAIKSVDRALQFAPNDYFTLMEKANVLRAQGNLDGAAALLRKVIELQPLQAWRYRELGSVLMTQAHYKEALENFTTARQLTVGSNPLMDSNLAAALLANGRFPEAIAQARVAMVEFSPDAGRDGDAPWLMLIAAEIFNGQDAEARADLQKFLTIRRVLNSMAAIQKVPLFAANQPLIEGLRRAGMPAE